MRTIHFEYAPMKLTRKDARRICMGRTISYSNGTGKPKGEGWYRIGVNYGIYGWNWDLWLNELDPKLAHIDGYRNLP